MSQRDKWAKRPIVEKYRVWCDEARLAATGSPSGHIQDDVIGIYAFAYIEMPASWPEAKKQAMAGKLHRQRPDSSNIGKACEDALFQEDSTLSISQCVKFWCPVEESPRVDIVLLIAPPGVRAAS